MATPARPPASGRRVLLTGAGGFVGGAVARRLRERGDEVVAPVRDPRRAAHLAELGVQLVADDLADAARLAALATGADGLIHAAGSYRVGIAAHERGAMWDANVGTTGRVLDAVAAAGTPRAVVVSTCNVFGDTHGRVVDEAYRRDLRDGFLSWYDETKFRAHELAEERVAGGTPVVLVLPSQVYGPGDHSAVGGLLRRAARGELRFRVLDDAGFGFVHVDDLAAGIVAALDRGRPGAAHVLSGPIARLSDAVALAAAAGGRHPPALRLPTGLLRLAARAAALAGRPGPAEIVRASAGVTYWADHARATRELGFEPRGLEAGFRDVFGAPA